MRRILLLTVAIFNIALYSMAQLPKNIVLKKADYEAKKNLLLDLWQKPINWLPASKSHLRNDQIMMDLPDSEFTKGVKHLDTLMYMYVGVYYYFAMEHPSPGCDTIVGAFFKTSDTVAPAYIARYPMSLFKKEPFKPFVLCESLAYFTPFFKHIVKQPAELIICFKKGEVILVDDYASNAVATDYILKLTGIMTKYFLMRDKEYQRILCLWDDPSGRTKHMLLRPNTKEFQKAIFLL